MVQKDGSEVVLDEIHVRATEYTVGETGPEAMPADLPPTTAYTYTVELSVDEALAAGADSVTFSEPVPVYVENFIGFPTGMLAPVAFYDRTIGQWVPEENGTVIEILDIADGLAEVDTDGDEVADDGTELGIDEEERATLAELHEPGQSLWRIEVTHFSPCDINWFPYLPPWAQGWLEKIFSPDDDPCADEVTGSIIECQNQVLGESLPVTGTPFTLNYRSDRVPGFLASRTVDAPLTGPDPDPDWITVMAGGGTRRAGGAAATIFPIDNPTPNLVHRFTWDDHDIYDRPVRGEWVTWQ